MSESHGFPRALLTQPIERRLAYFEQYRVAHKTLMTVYNQLIEAIDYPGRASLILVVGPTGVGKSVLLEKTANEINRKYLPQLTNDPGRYGAVVVEASVGDTNNNLREFYRSVLEALNEPLINEKRAHRPLVSTPNAMVPRWNSSDELQHAMIQAFLLPATYCPSC